VAEVAAFPNRLFAMGYVVEGPLMLLLAVRFFAIRQATLARCVDLCWAWGHSCGHCWIRTGRRRSAVKPFACRADADNSHQPYAAAWIAFRAAIGRGTPAPSEFPCRSATGAS
jgi:hypothetical protein